MHDFARKPKVTQQATSARATKPGRAQFGQEGEAHYILHLQRTIGNQAVQRLLKTNRLNVEGESTTIRPLKQTAPAAIQRQTDFGLATSQNVTDYATKVGAYQRDKAKQNNSFEDLARYAISVSNDELQDMDIPIVKNIELKPIEPAAYFYSKKWAMAVNARLYTGKSGPLAIRQLSKAQTTDLIETIYHEARHVEQSFKVARLLAGQKYSEILIAVKGKVPEEIAKQAKAKPLVAWKPESQAFYIEQLSKNTGDDPKIIAKRIQDAKKRFAEHNEEVQQIQDWHDEQELIDLIYDFFGTIRTATSTVEEEVKKRKKGKWDTSKLQQSLDPVKKWVIPQLDIEIKRVSAQKNRSEMVKHLVLLRKDLAGMVGFVEEQIKSQTLTPAFMAGVIDQTARTIKAELKVAYGQLATEADAYRQQYKVTAAMKGK
jgi:hypothetical protein